jgi:cobalt/nickel transport protein
MKRINVLLILAVLALVVLPLCLVHRRAGESGIFAGTDDRAIEAIKALRPGYKPWFAPVFKSPSGEVTTLLFALQAAIGAGLIGYYLGLAKGRAERKRKTPGGPCT